MTAKPLRYEIHALRRMKQRGINKAQVQQAIRNPTRKRPSKRTGATRFEKTLSPRKRLCVAAEVTDEFIRVVTAFWMD
jgi:hypothetical protein